MVPWTVPGRPAASLASCFTCAMNPLETCVMMRVTVWCVRRWLKVLVWTYTIDNINPHNTACGEQSARQEQRSPCSSLVNIPLENPRACLTILPCRRGTQHARLDVRKYNACSTPAMATACLLLRTAHPSVLDTQHRDDERSGGEALTAA